MEAVYLVWVKPPFGETFVRAVFSSRELAEEFIVRNGWGYDAYVNERKVNESLEDVL